MGPVSGQGTLGYSKRDNEAKAKKNAIMRRMRGQSTGNAMNANVLKSNVGGVYY